MNDEILHANEDDFFDTSEFETTESTPTDEVEENQVEENQTEETIQEQPEEAFLKIKYNKEEKALTMEEAIALSQKGMNYDKLQERLNQVESNPGLNYLNELAQRHNTTIDEMVNHWREQERQAEINQLVQNNIPEEYAREMIENKKFREEFEARQQAEASKEKQNAEFKEFFDTFPGVDPKEIPAEVWAANDNGIPLKHAYMEHKYQQLLKENTVLKTNNKNKQSSPVSGTATYGDKDNQKAYDPFLDGFNS